VSAPANTVHATAIAKWRAGVWRGVLLFGSSGAGKSDLALRAIQHGWRLVADDYSLVWRSGDGLWARAPDTIVNRIEARGLGLLPEPAICFAQAVLAVQCQLGPIERLPDPEAVHVHGMAIPCVRVRAFEASAVAKLERALSTRALGAQTGSAY
jgi:serine kinase of HPr protein (carbohydrate metabolism regulator)